MLLQEKVERQTEAAFAQSPRAVVAGRATLGKQSHTRFARVEIFGSCGTSGQEHRNAKRQENLSPQYHLHRAPQRLPFLAPN